jgi:hypothetical protein
MGLMLGVVLPTTSKIDFQEIVVLVVWRGFEEVGCQKSIFAGGVVAHT